MRAFWWFKENSIAGMARPGFNGIHWFDLPFDEAVVYGWVGQRQSGSQSIASLQQHIREFGEKIFRFHKIDESGFRRVLESFTDKTKFVEVFEKLALKTKSISHFEIDGEQIKFQLSPDRLAWEIDFLKRHGIGTVVTLTENHNQKEELEDHFDLHHLAIDDLQPPRLEQAQQLAEIIRMANSKQERLVVHCMAGIGRTSTMLMAAHLLLGEPFADLQALLTKQNPSFQFTGSQADFLQAVAGKRG